MHIRDTEKASTACMVW